MSNTKHKLKGYAIKGDGTQETAGRIRKVFEADGCRNWADLDFVDAHYYFVGEASEIHGHSILYYTESLPEIPLTEAEALVFGEELKPEDRVGKWWRMEFGGVAATFMVTSIEGFRVFGYGFNEKAGWFDRSDTNSGEYICYVSALDAHATEATPEEVEAMLVKEAKEKYSVGDVVIDVYDGEKEDLGDELNIKVTLHDASGDCVVWHYGYACLFKNGKWATLITPAPEKPKYKLGDWVCNKNYPTCFGQVTKIDGEKVYYDGYDLMKNLRYMTPEEIAAVTQKPQHTDKFPRVMWVWDRYSSRDIIRKTVCAHHEGDYYPWWCEFDLYRYASDTHPVTGEPAVKKDVVEQIREVVECELTPEIDMVRQIKEILKTEK